MPKTCRLPVQKNTLLPDGWSMFSHQYSTAGFTICLSSPVTVLTEDSKNRTTQKPAGYNTIHQQYTAENVPVTLFLPARERICCHSVKIYRFFRSFRHVATCFAGIISVQPCHNKKREQPVVIPENHCRYIPL